MSEDFVIVFGLEYIYRSGNPVKCHGFRYRPLREVLDVPSYQQKILVEALNGPDRGLYFTCSPANFANRYVLAPQPRTTTGGSTEGSKREHGSAQAEPDGSPAGLGGATLPASVSGAENILAGASREPAGFAQEKGVDMA